MKKKSKSLSEPEALHMLGKFTAKVFKQSDQTEPTGSCVYKTASGASYCAVLTEEFCNQLGGTWTEGGSCP